MYQLYGKIDNKKYFSERVTLGEIYVELKSLSDWLLSAATFNLFIVDPDGTEIQSVSK